ncbi:hypothetical protein OCH239_10260 [Roseivivax halodurans JCM 10272]|uniref:3-deoxy-manno-octulosonate cytidylyltransferase n=1 Tax=Roseivivax halodurans JCM 10272 TaxID=1449350 RepID=X7EBN9_9RHOB|nr:hypothetical protein OCH239_10260 [Roseivivax halodurans JCM 10272]
MDVTILIPARYASQRFPGKPLAKLTLPNGTTKSLIEMTWEAANKVRGATRVAVATDDTRIAETSRAFGAEVIMTSEACGNGTERCADALARAGIETDLVVNLQGDAPLTPPWFVEALIAAMEGDPAAQMATPVLRCDTTTYGHFVEDRKAGRWAAPPLSLIGRDGRSISPRRSFPISRRAPCRTRFRSFTMWGSTLTGLQRWSATEHGRQGRSR